MCLSAVAGREPLAKVDLSRRSSKNEDGRSDPKVCPKGSLYIQKMLDEALDIQDNMNDDQWP
jgi:hypothetical protein